MGGIKFNHGFKRFRLMSDRKVRGKFGLVALTHNFRKYPAMLSLADLRSRKHAFVTA